MKGAARVCAGGQASRIAFLSFPAADACRGEVAGFAGEFDAVVRKLHAAAVFEVADERETVRSVFHVSLLLD